MTSCTEPNSTPLTKTRSKTVRPYDTGCNVPTQHQALVSSVKAPYIKPTSNPTPSVNQAPLGVTTGIQPRHFRRLSVSVASLVVLPQLGIAQQDRSAHFHIVFFRRL